MNKETTGRPKAMKNLANIDEAERSGRKHLGLGPGPQLRRNGAYEFWLKAELPKNRADLPKGHRRRFEFHVNDIVVAIYLVMQPGNGFELHIELHDFVQLPNPGRVNFQLQHASIVGGRSA